jgi:hypothetical protein
VEFQKIAPSKANDKSSCISDKSHALPNEQSDLGSLEDLSNNETTAMLNAKRVRKNRDQIKELQHAFEKSGGNWTKTD